MIKNGSFFISIFSFTFMLFVLSTFSVFADATKVNSSDVEALNSQTKKGKKNSLPLSLRDQEANSYKLNADDSNQQQKKYNLHGRCNRAAGKRASYQPRQHEVHFTNNARLQTGDAVDSPGKTIVIIGTVFDSQCVPVVDALVELSQRDAHGQKVIQQPVGTNKQKFRGFARTRTNNNGEFVFYTMMPGGAPEVSLGLSHPDMPSWFAHIGLGYAVTKSKKSESSVSFIAIKRVNPVEEIRADYGYPETIYDVELTWHGQQRYKELQ
jgi:hypothetical protein